MPPLKSHSSEGTVADQDSSKTSHHIHSPREHREEVGAPCPWAQRGGWGSLSWRAPVQTLLKSGHKPRPPQEESLNLAGWVSLFSIICVLGQKRGAPQYFYCNHFFSVVILIWSQMLALKMTQNYLAILVHSYPVLAWDQLCQFTYYCPRVLTTQLLPQGPHHSTLDGPFVTSILLQLQSKWDKGELAVKGKPSQTW